MYGTAVPTYDRAAHLALQFSEATAKIRYNKRQFDVLAAEVTALCEEFGMVEYLSKQSAHHFSMFYDLLNSMLAYAKEWSTLKFSDALRASQVCDVKIEKFGGEMQAIFNPMDKQAGTSLLQMKRNLESCQIEDRIEFVTALKAMSEDPQVMLNTLQVNTASMVDAMMNLQWAMVHLDTSSLRYISKVLAALQRRTQTEQPLHPIGIARQRVVQTDLLMDGRLFQEHKGIWEQKIEMTVCTFIEKATSFEFRREMQTWSNLHHPNLLELYGVDQTSRPFMAFTPFYKHRDVVAYLTSVPISRRMKIATDVAAAIDYLHKKRVIHGDLRTAHILVDGTGSAKVTNFGMSMLDTTYTTTLTPTLPPREEDRYRSPEFLLHSIMDRPSDVYSLGVTIWEILTCEQPWAGYNEAEATAQILDGKTLQRSGSTSAATDEIWQTVEATFHMEPEKRPDARSIALQFMQVHKEMVLQRQSATEAQLTVA